MKVFKNTYKQRINGKSPETNVESNINQTGTYKLINSYSHTKTGRIKRETEKEESTQTNKTINENKTLKTSVAKIQNHKHGKSVIIL